MSKETTGSLLALLALIALIAGLTTAALVSGPRHADGDCDSHAANTVAVRGQASDELAARGLR